MDIQKRERMRIVKSAVGKGVGVGTKGENTKESKEW